MLNNCSVNIFLGLVKSAITNLKYNFTFNVRNTCIILQSNKYWYTRDTR